MELRPALGERRLAGRSRVRSEQHGCCGQAERDTALPGSGVRGSVSTRMYRVYCGRVVYSRRVPLPALGGKEGHASPLLIITTSGPQNIANS